MIQKILLFCVCFVIPFIWTCLNSSFHRKLFTSVKIDSRPWQDILEEKTLKEIPKKSREENITGIVIHESGEKNSKEYLNLSLQSGFFIHYLIDKKGILYGDSDPTEYYYPLIPKMDKYTIHISLEGKSTEILKNTSQINSLSKLIKTLSEKLEIPINNQNINEKKGIFTHFQARKKYGYFPELTECGSEELLKKIITSLNGIYEIEENWSGRYEKDWVVRKEKKDPNAKPTDFDRGRNITIQPIVELDHLEKDPNGRTPEKFRLQYVFKQKIQPSCIVLHYTAIPSFKVSQDVLESRKLSATIMVDTDGKAYQLLDFLDDMAQAASGTNQNCIQIEIVGKNTNDLMANELQTTKVVSLVKDISEKYKIPLSNEKIESLNGVYSHTQAKKKWGGSIALIGKEFDPGEIYMEKVLNLANGKFFEEKDWFERDSENWIMIRKDFQP